MYSLIVAAGNFHERPDHSDHGSQQTCHGSNSTHIVQVADPVRQDARLTRTFGVRDLADLLKSCPLVFGHEVERLLCDSRNALVLPMTMR